MGQKIQIRRGAEANLPSFRSGEFGLTEDTKKVFIGTPTGNVEMSKKVDVDSSITATKNDLEILIWMGVF